MSYFTNSPLRKKFALTTIIIVVLVQSFSFTLLRPSNVYAFVDVNQGVRNVTDNVGDAILATALGALVNGASYFMRKVAYDSAVWVASGAKGQSPLAHDVSFGKYLGSVALDSAASAIESIGTNIGFNLCTPTNVRFQIGLQVAMSDIVARKYGGPGAGPKPSCDWEKFSTSWEAAGSELYGGVTSDQSTLEFFNKGLKSSQGEIGNMLAVLNSIDNLVSETRRSAELERLEGQGFKALTEAISGNIMTPSQVVKKETDALTKVENTKLSTGQIAGIYGSGALQIIPMALGVFATTLLDSILERGLLPTKRGDPSGVADFYASSLNNNRRAAEQAFSYLITGTPQYTLAAYDVVTEYSTCSANPGLNNCVMDSGMVQALDRARTGAPLTIADALAQNLLHSNWPLIPPSREVDNSNLQYCHGSAYCFSNIQKLRKARMVPLGFEIAVRKSDPDRPWTLGEVVRGFYDCDPSGNPSPAHPYCKLIDPNWILKAPQARCEALVNGPELLAPNLGVRREECVDFSTCLDVDSEGQCLGYGYCTKEENVWRMPGESCPAHFNTCKTYTATDGAIASYLSRTIDTDVCSLDSVGCRAYSMDQRDGEWSRTALSDLALAFAGRPQSAHFNVRMNNFQCPSSAEGCSLFMDPATEQQVYLKKAPDYLGCYDVNPTTPQIDWPGSQAELTQLGLAASAQCSSFAGACIASEVGCDAYTPSSGGVSVTGIVGGNSCASQCIGYDTFRQESTVFEPSAFPTYFIPSSATTCAIQHVGCDQFTNIGVAAQGGEGIEYYSNLRHCERPEGQNGKVFYSYEGSQSQGYVLRRHTLLRLTEQNVSYINNLSGLSSDGKDEIVRVDSPAYHDDSATSLQNNYNRCNSTSYSLLINNPYHPEAAHPDCRAFYDTAGEVYYRILRDTVSVSDMCTPLRKTVSNLYVDNNINGGEVCALKGGKWTSGNCERCYNGGRFDSATESCIYQSIREEATSCPASANLCRSYIGNTGNNLHQVAFFGFEPADTSTTSASIALAGWGGTVSIASESVQVGLHSMRVGGAVGTSATHTFEAGVIRPGGTYELSFWARGSGAQTLDVSFVQNGNVVGNQFTYDPLTTASVNVPIGPEWQEYRLGPVQFTGSNESPVQLVFTKATGASGAFYFMDNMTLTQIGGLNNDHVFLVKNSWRTPEGYDVPLACDSAPFDGLPGEALGCRAYTRSDGQSLAITGFDRLCRSEAVGCRALVDTENTVTGAYPTEKMAYGLLCHKRDVVTDVSAECSFTILLDNDREETFSCTVERGKQNCRINVEVPLPESAQVITGVPNATSAFMCVSGAGVSCDNRLVEGERDRFGNVVGPSYMVSYEDRIFMDNSTMVFRADSDQIYLTHRSEFSCASQHLGCTRVALEDQVLASDASNAFNYRETFVLNDPRHYFQTVCTGDQVGCAQFKQDSAITYFKDPRVTGQSLCVYKDNAGSTSGTRESGWYLHGMGTCGATDALCKTNDDCATGVSCINVGTTACYPDYQEVGNTYGIWSAGSAQYQGKVGVCDAGFAGCTELVDRAAVSSATPDGKSYYVIMNERLMGNVGQCEGKAGQRDGCVLFDMTENPTKIYNTAQTYENSNNATPPYSLVPPSTVGTLDANLVVKVTRDRACSEWLSCRTSITIFDESGRPQSLCQDYAACSVLGPSGECLEWVDTRSDNSRLTEANYIARDTSWNAPEYSGYSIFNAFNPSDFVYLMFPGTDVAHLGYEMSHTFFAEGSGFVGQGCRERAPGGASVKLDGDPCGFDDGGRCYKDRCLYPMTGPFQFTSVTGPDRSEENIRRMLGELEPGICKSYPEVDSPFSQLISAVAPYRPLPLSDDSDSVIRTEYPERKELYNQANICQPGSINDGCSCEYIKVQYKNGTTDYWPSGTKVTTIPTGVCTGVGGAMDGKPCVTNSDCSDSGVCSLIDRQSRFVGQKGLCLEYDLSRPLGVTRSNARMHESFACLTWLPIKVSASSADLYNAFQGAGYDPTIDAVGIGGHAYCTQGTYRADGGYDLTTGGSFGGEITKEDVKEIRLYNDEIYSGWFAGTDATQITYTKLFQSVSWIQNCGDADNRENYLYARLMCGSQDNSTSHLADLYRTAQVWAWENVGQSSRVLRMDTGGGVNERYMFAQGGAYRMFGFAPPIGNTISGTSNPRDTGVIMHPPRFSIEQSVINNYQMNTGNFQSANVETAYTGAFSPVYSTTESNNLYIDRTAELNLVEADLKAVHFTALAYPGRVSGAVPLSLRKPGEGVFIDFAYLRSLVDNPERTSRNFIRKGNTLPAAVHKSGDNPPFVKYADDSGREISNYSYVLERSISSFNCYGLLSHCNYTGDGGGGTSVAHADPRNVIFRRYVSVWYQHKDSHSDVGTNPPFNFHVNPQLLTQDFAVFDSSQDPFTKECLPSHGNWLAIGMDFNRSGEFLGYISRWCNGHNNTGVRFITIADLYDRCTQFAAVYDDDVDPLTGTSNKAWTNTVWLGAPNNSAYMFLLPNSSDSIRIDQSIRPFGSLRAYGRGGIRASVLRVAGENSPGYSFDYNSTTHDGGVPYRCGSSADPIIFSNRLFTRPTVGCHNPPELAGVTDAIFARFAKIFEVRTLRPDRLVSNDDQSRTIAGTPTPPRIFALNPSTCKQRGMDCTAGEANAFTLNMRNYTLTDYSGDGLPDEAFGGVIRPIIAERVYGAVINFFAYADHNHMPIRRVMVDWGNGSTITNEDRIGLYKNRKPYCATDNTQAGGVGLGRCGNTQLTCRNDSDCAYLDGGATACNIPSSNVVSFGDAPRACTDEYFEFSHTYFCGSGDTNAVVGDLVSVYSEQEAYNRLIARADVNDTTRICVFRPRVQVLDNWGWCNGTCHRSYDGNGNPVSGSTLQDGCYDNVTYGSVGDYDQCNANFKQKDSASNPWTDYKGVIVIVP